MYIKLIKIPSKYYQIEKQIKRILRLKGKILAMTIADPNYVLIVQFNKRPNIHPSKRCPFCNSKHIKVWSNDTLSCDDCHKYDIFDLYTAIFKESERMGKK